LGEVLGTVRGDDERLGALIEIVDFDIVQDGAESLTDGGAPVLAGEHRV